MFLIRIERAENVRISKKPRQWCSRAGEALTFHEKERLADMGTPSGTPSGTPGRARNVPDPPYATRYGFPSCSKNVRLHSTLPFIALLHVLWM